MNALRKILMPLLAIPLGMFLYGFTHPDLQWESGGLESLFAAIGIPILVINFIAWFYPEILKAYFPIKEDWGEKRMAPVALAIAISAFVALTCISVGVASSVTDVSTRPTFKPSVQPPATAFAFARSGQMYPDTINSTDSDIVPLPSPSAETDIAPAQALRAPGTTTLSEQTPQIPETDITPEPTPQLPISGSAATRSPALPVPRTGTAATSTQPTSTVSLATACTPANANYVDAVLQEIQAVDPDNKVDAAWEVQSKAAPNLWFVAAKISGPQINTGTLPAVWGLFTHPAGYFDIYAINSSAMDSSYSDWGEDSDPVLSMQTDGAQAAYDCAVHAH